MHLNGFTITAGPNSAVTCNPKCRIIGPGLISDTLVAIHVTRRGSVENVTITNHVRGIDQQTTKNHGKLLIRNSAIGNNTRYGIQAHGAVRILASTISDNGEEGVSAARAVKVKDSTITGNGLSGILLSGIPDYGRYATLVCYRGGKLGLGRSTVTGNGLTHPDCGVSTTCTDLGSCRKPRLDNESSCDTSYFVNPLDINRPSWGVCSLD